jgi:glycerate dehydrogenase
MKIVILDAKTLGSDISLEPFQKLGEVTIYELTRPEEVMSRIADADVIITNKVMLHEENLKEAKALRLIALTATGYNNVDVAYAKEKGIAVTNVAGYSTDSVVQHTFALLFQLLEHLSFYDDYVKSKLYSKSDTFSYIGRPFYEVKGKVWGIIGLGTIGKEVARIATAFGAKIYYYSTSGKNTNDQYEKLSLEELLRVSDIVSIHAPLNQNTQNLLAYKELSLMKETALLLNLGRGGIVNECDLAQILNEEKIRGAALDVLEQEPIDENNPLYTVRNKGKWLVTPHIGWGSVEARILLVEEVSHNIIAFTKGESRNRIV